jgi:hypothetical protein
MKQHAVLVGAFLLCAHSASAIAQCSNAGGYQKLNGSQITTALSGMRLVAVGPSDDWKEDHCPTGTLYKVGDGTPVDPRALRGSWQVVGDQIRYSYTGDSGSPYTWDVWRKTSAPNQGQLSFCNGASEIAHSTSVTAFAATCP